MGAASSCVRAQPRTVFRGFLFYYGAALGDVLCGEELARNVGVEGARGLARLFNDKAGIIPLGKAAEEATSVGESEANIDGMQSSALLKWAAERSREQRLAEIAARHALRNLRVFVRSDHSVVQSASIDTATGRVLRTYTHKVRGYETTAHGPVPRPGLCVALRSTRSGLPSNVLHCWLRHRILRTGGLAICRPTASPTGISTRRRAPRAILRGLQLRPQGTSYRNRARHHLGTQGRLRRNPQLDAR
jgi:hypothetical protein